MPLNIISFLSPFGDMTLFSEDDALIALDWGRGADPSPSPLLNRAVDQLQRYFDGDLEAFDLPLRPEGTAFEQKVWREMQAIPYGATMSYGDLAARIGSVARAVGRASARNPLPILIPCHRVLAANGALTGYSGEGGIETKAALLRLEGARLDL